MIYELPNFITEAQLEKIYAHLAPQLTNENQEYTYKQGSYRDGQSIFISQNESLKDLDSFLLAEVFNSELLSGFINRRYAPNWPTGDSGYEFHRYAPGDLCHIHSDGEVPFHDTKSGEVLLRFASVVLHLNTPSSGGDLIFPGLNKTVKTEARKLVIFPPYGFAQHYTTESSDNRDVVVTWFVYKNLLVRRI